jgi:hypothetical protein
MKEIKRFRSRQGDDFIITKSVVFTRLKAKTIVYKNCSPVAKVVSHGDIN